MKVELLQHMGSDLTVVNAARVSHHKKATGKCSEDFDNGCRDCPFDPGPTGLCHRPAGSDFVKDRDAKLIRYLVKNPSGNVHFTPFAHTALTFRIKAPIFVARQLGKHQVGLVWNEVSRRYVDEEPEIHQPDEWRKRADNVKQGSSDEAVQLSDLEWWEEKRGEHIPADEYLSNHMTECVEVYKALLVEGVAPEQARMVLPQSMMTEWWWTGSLAAFARVCKLRLDPHSQQETRQIAEEMAKLIEPLFPVSWQALMEN